MKVSKIFTRAVAAAALVGLCAAPALAQRGKWWQDERFRRELGLTAEQSTRLEEIFQKHLPKLRQHMQALDQAEDQLNQLIEKGDDASVMAHMGVVESARAEMNKTRTLMLLRMRRSLTGDQWAKFTALANERNQRRRGSTLSPR
ncbi:MAG: periplasmic heavy metal sensor [Acidobacteria bacterium]|nr:periplasmic heavy metal sensor [Acidobacteriota bacterium]